MHDNVLRAVIGLEYQVALLAAAPLTTLLVGWAARQAAGLLRDRRAGACAARLVAWAEQVIPAKSARYGEVAALLSRRFPMLSGEQLEVLIESEVLDLKTALRAAAPAAPAAPAAAVVATTGNGAEAVVTAATTTATADTASAASAPAAGAQTAPPSLRVGGA
jgi:hypothetical protein